MKFKNETLAIREYAMVTIPRRNYPSIELRVNSIPMGLKRDFEIMCPRPRPPFTMTVTKNGPKREDNYDDVTFINEVADYRDLERYYFIYVAICNNPDLQIENVPMDLESLRKFRTEFRSTGMSEGDVKLIIDAATAASNISDEDIKQAGENF